MSFVHTFLPKPSSVTFVYPQNGGNVKLTGVDSKFSSQFKPGNLLRVVQRLPSGGPGNDWTVTVKSVESDTAMTLEETSLPGSGCDIDEDVTINSFLGYKRSVPQLESV